MIPLVLSSSLWSRTNLQKEEIVLPPSSGAYSASHEDSMAAGGLVIQGSQSGRREWWLASVACLTFSSETSAPRWNGPACVSVGLVTPVTTIWKFLPVMWRSLFPRQFQIYQLNDINHHTEYTWVLFCIKKITRR